MSKLGSCDNLIWEGLQYASRKAEERKQKTIRSFTLDELKTNPATRASVALRLGNIEIERIIEEDYFKKIIKKYGTATKSRSIDCVTSKN